MRTYTWDEYYDKFYDWAESTRAKNLTYLENLGDSDEIAEIIIELKDNKNAAMRLLRRAVEEKVEFTGEALVDLFFWEFDKTLLLEALSNSAGVLTTEDIEEFYLTVDDAVLLEICRKGNIPIPEDLKEDTEFVEIEEPIEKEFEQETYQKPKKLGLFGTMLAVGLALGSSGNSSSKKKHNGRCDGDCANCPPHYGYRYGRWYYGKGHVHGCQFGGNRGDGSL